MKKLAQITWMELFIAIPAFGIIASAIGGTAGALVIVACVLLLSAIAGYRDYRYRKLQQARQRIVNGSTLRDYMIARDIVQRAYGSGKINRQSYIRGELFIDRTLSLNRLVVGIVKKNRTLSPKRVIRDRDEVEALLSLQQMVN